MRVTFQTEKWADALPELRYLFDQLWAEVAVDKSKMKAKCDEKMYANLDHLGILHLVTARKDSILIGFFLAFITTNGHYEDAGLFAFTDMYFTLPEHRKGGLGARLFLFMETTLRAKKVVKFVTSHKVLNDNSGMLKALGFKHTDQIFSKLLA